MKRILSLLLALSLLFALAACASGTKTPEATKSTSDATAAPTAADTAYTGSDSFDISKYDGVKIDIMWQETDSTQIDIVNNYAKAAIQDKFGKYVEVNWIGNVDTDVATLAQTNELADIWFGSASLEMIESGIIMDLAPYLNADTYLADNFSNPAFYNFNDHIWALSTGVDNFYTGTMYINQDIFDKVGITSVATYDELFAACQKLKDAGYTPITHDGDGGGVFMHFMFQNLIVSVDPKAYNDLVAGGDINSEATTKAMQLYADMRDAGFFGTGTSVKTTSDSVSSFVEGKAAMLYTQSWNNDSVKAAPFKVTVAWWPTANDKYATGEYIANWGSPLSGWIGNSKTEYPELVVEMIKTIVKAEAQRHLTVGLQTNYKQDGTPVPTNDLEAQRLVLFNKVGTWCKCFLLNTMDSTTQTEFKNQCITLMSDDHYPVADFITAVQAAWDTNTFFK